MELYFGENFLYDAQLIVIAMLNDKHRSLKDTREHFRILCAL